MINEKVFLAKVTLPLEEKTKERWCQNIDEANKFLKDNLQLGEYGSITEYIKESTKQFQIHLLQDPEREGA